MKIPALCTVPGCFERVLFGLGLEPVRWLCGEHGNALLELERAEAAA